MDTTIETQMKKLETIRKMKTADEILAKYEYTHYEESRFEKLNKQIKE